jgi:hypothetical protein
MSAYDSNPTLPLTKVDSHGATTPANQTITAAEFNALVTAVADLRAALVGGTPSEGGAANSLTLAQNGSPPASAATKAALYTDGARLLGLINGDTTAHKINPDWINVVDYGADPTGAIDSTAAIRLAVKAVVALQTQVSYGSQAISVDTAPILYFPPGVYLLSNYITQNNGVDGLGLNMPLRIEGHNAMLKQTDPTKDIIAGGFLPFNYSIKGLTFLGGANQLRKNLITNSNNVVKVENCTFVDPNSACYYADANDRGVMQFDACFMWASVPGTNLVNALGGDHVNMRHCYVNIGTGDAFITAGPIMHLDDILAVPIGLVAGGYWLNISSSEAAIMAFRLRMGGEQAKKVLKCTANGFAQIILKDCPTYGPSNGNTYEFYDLPGLVYIEPADGQGQGVYFDAGIPNASKQLIGNSHRFYIKGLTDFLPSAANVPLPVDAATSGDQYTLQAMMLANLARRDSRPLAADYVLGIPPNSSNFGAVNSSDNLVSTTTTTDIFGNTVLEKTATANEAVAHKGFTSVNLPTGLYTLEAAFAIAGSTVNVQISAGDFSTIRSFEPGTHVVNVPFQIGSATASNSFGVSAHQMPNGNVFTFQSFRIFSGNKLTGTLNLEVLGAPPPATGLFQTGDRCKAPQPAAGGSPGSICTTLGGAASGAWQATHAYVWGNQVTNGGNVYFCRIGGTSAGSGGPSGTGSGIVDGGVTWEFLAAPAVFKAEASLAA